MQAPLYRQLAGWRRPAHRQGGGPGYLGPARLSVEHRLLPTCRSALPTCLSQAAKHVFVVLGPEPCWRAAHMVLEPLRRDSVFQRFTCLIVAAKLAQCRRQPSVDVCEMRITLDHRIRHRHGVSIITVIIIGHCNPARKQTCAGITWVELDRLTECCSAFRPITKHNENDPIDADDPWGVGILCQWGR